MNLTGNTNLLTIILDTNPFYWGLRLSNVDQSIYDSKQASFTTMMEHLIVFLNAYLRIGENLVSIIANHNTGARFLYPNQNHTNSTQTSFTDIVTLKECMLSELSELVSKPAKDQDLDKSYFSAAFSMALCCKKHNFCMSSNWFFSTLIIQILIDFWRKTRTFLLGFWSCKFPQTLICNTYP